MTETHRSTQQMVESVRTPQDFAAALTAVKDRAGLSIREMSRRSGIPAGSVGDYVSGRHLVPGTRPEVLTDLLTTLGVPAADHEAWRDALARARRNRGRATPHAEADDVPNPYRGLAAYGVEDGDWFFGRDELVAEGVARIEAVRAAAERSRLVTVVGPSGSGKSSLVRAGLAGRLVEQGWRVAVRTPGDDPSSLDDLAELDLVVVDQFEEVFTADRDSQRAEAWVGLVSRAAVGREGLAVVVAIRGDFMGALLDEPRLLPLVPGGELYVGPMSEGGLHAAASGPAAKAGRPLSEETVRLVVSDGVGSLGGSRDPVTALPLVSHALMAAWAGASGELVTPSDYLRTGGVAAAVANSAEAAYASLSEDGKAAAPRLFARLVHLSDDDVATRRVAAREDLAGLEIAALDDCVTAFVEQRVLTADAEHVELSHEALLRAWPRLQAWIADGRDHLREAQRIARSEREWREHDQDAGFLLRGAALSGATNLAAGRSPHVQLTEQESRFVEASVAAQEAARARARRRRSAAMAGVAAVVVLALVAVGFAVSSERARSEAQTIAQEARSRQLANRAADLADTDPDIAAQLAVAAYAVSPTLEARSTLLGTSGRALVGRLEAVPGAVATAASDDGAVVATVGEDGALRVYDATVEGAPAQVAELDVADAPLGAAAFRPGTRELAIGGQDQQVTFVDLADPGAPAERGDRLSTEGFTVASLDWSTAGDRLVAGLASFEGPGAVARWQIGSGAADELARLDLDAAPGTVAFDDAGESFIALSGAEGVLYAAPGDEEPTEVGSVSVAVDGSGAAQGAAWSGDTVAVGSTRNEVRLWDVGDPAQPSRIAADLGEFPSFLNGLAFSADGGLLGAASSGGRAVVYDLGQQRVIADFEATSNLTTVAFDEASRSLVVGGIDGYARVYPYGGWGSAEPIATAYVPLMIGDRGVLSTSAGLQVYELDDEGRPGDFLGTVTGSPDGGDLSGASWAAPGSDVVYGGTTDGRVLAIDVAGPRPRITSDSAVFAEDSGISSLVVSGDGSVVTSADGTGRVAVSDVQADGSLTERVNFRASGGGVVADSLVEKDLVVVASLGAPEISGFDISDAAEAVEAGRDPEPMWTRELPVGTISTVSSASEPLVAITRYDETVLVLDLSDPAKPRQVGEILQDNQGVPWNPAFGDGTGLLGTGGSDGNAYVWRAREGGSGYELYARMPSPTRSAYFGVAFDDGQVTAAGSGTATTFDLDPAAASARICAAVGAPLTRAEWQSNAPGLAFRDPCRGARGR